MAMSMGSRRFMARGVARPMNGMNGVVLVAVTALFLVSSTAKPQISSSLIPPNSSQLNSWFEDNVRPYTDRNGTLDAALFTAEAAAKTITVYQDGSGDFRTIADAIASIPDSNVNRTIIAVGSGVYTEKIVINSSKPFVTLFGSPESMPTLTYNGTAAQYGTVDSATLIVKANYFMAVNMKIVNSSPKPGRKGAQAVAMRISGDRAAFYNCSFIGFQDTLCDDFGRHFFKDCYVQGTVDFIFGSGKSIYLNTELYVTDKHGPSVITAQGRDKKTDDSGYSFAHCHIDGNATDVYLGRAWMSYPIVVFSYTYMSDIINPLGWSDNLQPARDNTTFFGECNCFGPGSSLARRAAFAKPLSVKKAEPFLDLAYINATNWLLPYPTF